MNRCLRAVLFLLILGAAHLAGADEGIISLTDYKARLHQYEEQIQKTTAQPEFAVDFYREVPDQIRVQTLSGTITVPLKFLHDGLENFLKSEPAAKPTILGQLSSRIQALETEADHFESADPGNPAARERLNKILSAREFRSVQGPSEWELLLDRISNWLSEKFDKLFPNKPDLNQAGQIFVWVMIAIACSILAVWLYRASRGRLLDRPREIVPFLPSARSWRLWLSDAREKAGAGQLREAIRLGFWAAVSRLESDGVWRPDKARTPREYLSSIPAGTETRSTFAAVTRTFEAAWYGGRPASSGDFEQFLSELEKLGCRG
jgi:uncharacterized protein DUF4129